MLPIERLAHLADKHTPNTETGSLNYEAYGRAIEAEVRAQDTALIQQMQEALDRSRFDSTNMSMQDIQVCSAARQAARARLKEIAP